VSTFCEHAANKIKTTKYFLNIFYTLKSTRLIVGVIYPENTKIKKVNILKPIEKNCILGNVLFQII